MEISKIKLLNSELAYDHKVVTNSSKNIVFVHGYGANMEQNKIVGDVLSENYSYYNLHLPAHGSSKAKVVGEINLYYYTDLIWAFLRKLELKNVVIIGHSMGGAVVSLLFEKYDTTTIIEKVIEVAPVNQTTYNLKDRLLEMFFPPNLDAWLATMHKYCKPLPEYLKDAKFLATKVQQIDFFNGPTVAGKGMVELGKSFFEPRILKDIEAGIKKISVPFLLVFGSNDQVIDTKNIKSYFQKINPKTEVVEIANIAHVPWVEKPEVIQEVLGKFIA